MQLLVGGAGIASLVDLPNQLKEDTQGRRGVEIVVHRLDKRRLGALGLLVERGEVGPLGAGQRPAQ
ncbi:MAG TPA: hypothetical protein VJ182_01260, partial [Anaerolineales bacterium]|nr:hypothetical protein [Anaerolineales bacterium]